MEISNKWSAVIIVVVTVVCSVGLVLLNRCFGSQHMFAAIVVLLAIANLITAVSLEKKEKRLKELEKKVEELTKK